MKSCEPFFSLFNIYMYKFITAKETIIYWYIGNLALCVIKIDTFSFSCLSKCHLHFNPFAPQPPVRIQVLSILCDVISF